VTNRSKQICLFPEGFHQRWASTHPTQCLASRPTQLAEVFGTEIGEFMLFAVAPNVFHRIEFGRIGRQEFQLDCPALSSDKLTHQPATMYRQTVPNDRQSTADVPLKVFQKLYELRSLDAAGEKPEIEIPDGDARDSRQTLPVERVLQHGRLAPRCPSANPVWPLAQTALVHKHYRSALLERFFFISGHRTRFHRWMAGSSRWIARPTGRWQLQPRERKIRHTCPG